MGEECAGVILINEPALKAHDDVAGADFIVVRHGKVTVGLAAIHDFTNPKTHRVDHPELHHRLGEEAIAIAGGSATGENIFAGCSIEEVSCVLKNELTLPLNHQNALLPGVILMSDAIVQSFEHDALVVFWNIHRDQLIGRQKTEA